MEPTFAEELMEAGTHGLAMLLKLKESGIDVNKPKSEVLAQLDKFKKPAISEAERVAAIDARIAAENMAKKSAMPAIETAVKTAPLLGRLVSGGLVAADLLRPTEMMTKEQAAEDDVDWQEKLKQQRFNQLRDSLNKKKE